MNPSKVFTSGSGQIPQKKFPGFTKTHKFAIEQNLLRPFLFSSVFIYSLLNTPLLDLKMTDPFINSPKELSAWIAGFRAVVISANNKNSVFIQTKIKVEKSIKSVPV